MIDFKQIHSDDGGFSFRGESSKLRVKVQLSFIYFDSFCNYTIAFNNTIFAAGKHYQRYKETPNETCSAIWHNFLQEIE